MSSCSKKQSRDASLRRWARLRQKLVPLSLLMALTCCTTDLEPERTSLSSYEHLRDGVSSVDFADQTDILGMAAEITVQLADYENPIGQSGLRNLFSNNDGRGGAFPGALSSVVKSVGSKVAASVDYFGNNAGATAKIHDDFDKYFATREAIYDQKEVKAQKGAAGYVAYTFDEEERIRYGFDEEERIRYVGAEGFEIQYVFSKSSFGALQLDQILNHCLTKSTTADNGQLVEGKSYTEMEHYWDEAYGYVYGLTDNPALPDSGEVFGSALHAYINALNNSTGVVGIRDDIFRAFLKGREAIINKDYQERDRQIAILREKLSTVLAYRGVFYLQLAKLFLPKADGSAVHSLSDAYGFIYALQFSRKPDAAEPYLTASEVEGLLAKLSPLWDLTLADIDEISEAVAAKFSFSVADTSADLDS